MPVPARHSLGWRKITSSPRNHQEKVAERKGKKKISLPGWTRETAFLPVKIIRVCVRFLWKNKGKKEGGGKKRNENVRRGGERERKPGNIDLIRGKGYRRFLTTLSVADISRIMHQPARNMFSSFIFFPSLSLFVEASSRNCQTIEVSRECATAYAVVWASSCSWIGLNSVCWDEKGLKRRVAARSRSRNDILMQEGGENLSKFLYLRFLFIVIRFWNFFSLLICND